MSLANFRKDIYLEFYNEAGQLVIAYKIYRCWVSEYQALPDLDANANAIAIEHIKLENEGLGARHQRDRTAGADAKHRDHLSMRASFRVPTSSICGSGGLGCIRLDQGSPGPRCGSSRGAARELGRLAVGPSQPGPGRVALRLFRIQSSRVDSPARDAGKSWNSKWTAASWRRKRMHERGQREPIVVTGERFRLPTSRDLAECGRERSRTGRDSIVGALPIESGGASGFGPMR